MQMPDNDLVTLPHVVKERDPIGPRRPDVDHARAAERFELDALKLSRMPGHLSD
ncbi:MAG: hypothetical protein AB7F78_00090 [Hyphomicrobiaceae bacterium]